MEKLPKFLFGFNRDAELLNGRGAMIAFIILIVIEIFLGKGILVSL